MVDSVATEPKSVPTKYLEAQQTVTNAQTRLNDLQAKAFGEGLTDAEELEQLTLERRLSNLQPVIQNLQRQVMLKQATLDIETVGSQWGALVPEKQAAYETRVIAS